ncbi:MAG: InlB B-repeat-containing protein [Spirochaetes bacterium]|nr:InlB B-repeat-containing protein [Spirochaetota bacterium]MBU1079308.1 InlB B-repeat-containing protein [Spirochaetota bacterium]
MAYLASPGRGRSVGAEFIVLLFLSTALAACRSPLALDAKHVDCSMSFVLSGVSASPVGEGDSRARLILPSSSRLTVTLRPEGEHSVGLLSSVVDIAAGATSVEVAFLNVPLGSYAVKAEASDATGTVLFRQESLIELGSESKAIDLCLVPVAAEGSPFVYLESARSILQTFSAYEAKTWTVPRAAFADGAMSLVAERTAGLLLFVQNSRGLLLNSDSSERTVDCSTLTGESLVYITLYNKSAVAGRASLSLNVPRTPAARWTFEVASTTDFPESVGGIVATRSGASQVVEWYNYRSAGALLLASSQSSYLSLSSSTHADAPPPWTVCAWLQTTDLSKTQALLSGSEGQTLLAADSSQRVGVVVGGVAYAFSSSIDNYVWTHVAIVNTGHDIRLYVDGVLDGVTITDTAAVAMKLPLSVIGNDAGSNFFEGRIDDLRAYRVALSASEVASLLASYPKELSYGGDSHGSVSVSPDLSYYEPGTVVTLTAVPNDATWKFDGWSGNASGYDLTTTIVMDADKTVAAAFATAVPRHSIVFNLNGGTGSLPSIVDVISGEERSIPVPDNSVMLAGTPNRHFPCWTEASDGSGAQYWPGDTFTVDRDIALYANWTVDDAPPWDGRGSAPIIAAGASKHGYIQEMNDEDTYRIQVTANGTLSMNVEMRARQELFDAWLYDQAGNLIDYSLTNDGGATYTVVSAAATAGFYYLRVTWRSGYSLGIWNPDLIGDYNIITTFIP